MHIFLTGEIQIGKSTAAARTLALLGVQPAGFCTYFGEDRKAPEHSLYIRNAWEAPTFTPEHIIADFHARGRPDFYRERFETLAFESLAHVGKAPLIVMDECGWLEREALGFQSRVQELLVGETPILGVVRQGGEGWLDTIRRHPNVRLIPVTGENRDALPAQLAALLQPQLGEEKR